jgi:hypothetical protein
VPAIDRGFGQATFSAGIGMPIRGATQKMEFVMKEKKIDGLMHNFILAMAKSLAVLLVLLLACQAALPAFASGEADNPLPVFVAPEPNSFEMTEAGWALYQVDAYHNFFNLTDRSLRFDKNGNPHVVYGGKHLYYAWYDGSQWNQTIVDGSPGVGEHAALALDSNNRPRISYYDAGNRSLKFAYFDGFSWITQTIDTPNVVMSDLAPENLHRMNPGTYDFQPMADPEGATGLYTSITVDNNNEVHISYLDTSYVQGPNTPGALRYAHWDGVSWEVGTLVDGRTPTGWYSSIAIAPNNQRPCISYLIEKYDDLYYVCQRADGSWPTPSVDDAVDAAGNVGAFTSLAFDSNSIPYISYYDFGEDNLKLAKKKSSGWEITTLDTGGDTGLYTSLAVRPSDNRIFISYIDASDALVRIINSSDWSPKTVANVSPEGRYTSIAIDKNGRPGVVYYRVENAQLVYSYNTSGNSWTTTVLDVAGDVGVSSSLDINASGSPYIGYGNITSQDLKYAYAFLNIWKKSNILASGYYAGQSQSLELDSSGRPQIAYYDAASGDLKLASWNGSVWELRTVDASANDVGRYVSLVMDGANRPHISYYDATAGDLKYAYWNGSSWSIKTILSTGDVGKYTSIDVDSANRPFISFYDATNADLRMAYLSPIDAWVTEPVDIAGDVGQYSAIVVDQYDQIHISYYDATNGDLKYAEYLGTWQTEVVDSVSNTGLYTSMAVDNYGKSFISYYNAGSGDLMFASGYPFSWTIEMIANYGVVGLYTSIDLFGGQPAISYYDYTNGELWVAMSYPMPPPPYSVHMPLTAKNY